MMGEPRKPGARWRHQRPRARRRSAGWIKRGSVPALLAVLLSGTTLATLARADGDPASDYLVINQVFLGSLPTATSASEGQLLQAVRAANRDGFPIRVAIISTDYDLGSITALWHKPRIYARFLGLELSLAYKQRLLVVMPNGFGFNWPTHSAASAYRLLAREHIAAGRTGVLDAAQMAVRRLAAEDGISIRSPTRTGSGDATGRSRHAWELAAVFAVIALLGALGILFAVQRRRRGLTGRSRSTRPRSPVRFRWAAPGLVVVLGLAVGIPILAVGIFRHASAAPNPQLSSAPDLPQVSWPPGRQPAPRFVLRDQAGRPVSLAAYRGRPVIVTFIDPLCRNFCPLAAHVLNQVVSQMPASRRPAILAVSVDVYANARADLLRDVRKWELVRQWHWAVGSPSELAAVWKRYKIGVSVVTKHISGIDIHYITHSEVAYIIDPTGHERALFLWPFYPQDVERVLRQLT